MSDAQISKEKPRHSSPKQASLIRHSALVIAKIVPMHTLQITNGRVIDPSQDLDRVADVWIEGTRILGIGPQPHLHANQVIDASSKIVCPGLIDMHVHLREPGREEDETIATGAAAAL